MKLLFAVVLPLLASVFASPLAHNAPDVVLKSRQLESQSAIITSLYQDVIKHTASITTPNDVEINAAAAAVAPELAAITQALTTATTAVSKRALVSLVSRQDACDAECVAEEVVALVYEITSTIRAIIEELGLDPVVVYINPLLLALSALVISLDVLVTGLLVTVTAVVNTILLGLGLSLAALGFSAS